MFVNFALTCVAK